jgi:nucleotidyltransferase/DNA polymerase involved in DNA repair
VTTLELIHEIEDHIDRLTQARALLRSSPAATEIDGITIYSGTSGATFHPIVTFPMPEPAPQPAPQPLPLLAPMGKADARRKEHRIRQLSLAAKDRISQAQKKRWRKFHREKKLAAKMQKEKVA